MSEEIAESKAETPEAKNKEVVELVDYEANRGFPSKVYPEIKEFFESRKRALWRYESLRSVRQSSRSAYILAEKQKFYADDANMGQSFDEYAAGAAWDRDNPVSDRRAEERKYYDFVNGDMRSVASRHNANNLNSWDELYKATTHPEVKWIIDNCLEAEGEALIIMGYLPATMDELWSLAKDRHGMCDTFDRYMQRAEASGLFEGMDRSAGVRELTALQSYVRRTYGRAYVSELSVHVTRLMKVMREDAAAQVAEARVEWQKLDEARAENATFNRSRAQKARYERERLAAAAADEAKAVIEDDPEGDSSESVGAVREVSVTFA